MQPEKLLKTSTWAYTKFLKWQSESGNTVDLKTSEVSQVAESLRTFYYSLQKDYFKILIYRILSNRFKASDDFKVDNKCFGCYGNGQCC